MHELDDITGAVIDAAIKIHRDLGPGLLESVYELVLATNFSGAALAWSGSARCGSNTTGSYSRRASAPIWLSRAPVVVEVRSSAWHRSIPSNF
jgi:iron complex transport system substrate-binding protein